MKMKDICATERPREKMLVKGAAALSEAELLAVLLRSGTKEIGVVDLANRLLVLAEGSLVKLFTMSYADMKSVSGIGPEKACSVMAACELGRRFLEEEARISKTPLTTARRVYELMIPSMKGMGHEEFWVLFLNKNNRLLGKECLSSGGMDATVIDNRMVMQACLQRGATSILLVHNHPSGDPKPSHDDIKRTEALRKACSAFGVGLLDHVIVSDDCFWSFADDRLYGA
jgi:DNA repair protein RadC